MWYLLVSMCLQLKCMRDRKHSTILFLYNPIAFQLLQCCIAFALLKTWDLFFILSVTQRKTKTVKPAVFYWLTPETHQYKIKTAQSFNLCPLWRQSTVNNVTSYIYHINEGVTTSLNGKPCTKYLLHEMPF